MLSPFIVAKWGGLFLLGGFAGMVGWKLADGSVPLDQLFEGDIRDRAPGMGAGFSTYVSAGRVQSFLVTLYAALYYLRQVAQDPTHLPAPPVELVGAVAGSQALYLLGKAQAMFIGRFRDYWK